MKRRSPFTLMEIMLVILIISLIGGVIGYSMKGSLEEGKAFKTKQGIAKIYDLLQMRIAEIGDAEEVIKDVNKSIQDTGLVRNVKELLKDGWGTKYIYSVEHGDVKIKSDALEKYIKKKGKKAEEYYPWLQK